MDALEVVVLHVQGAAKRVVVHNVLLIVGMINIMVNILCICTQNLNSKEILYEFIQK